MTLLAQEEPPRAVHRHSLGLRKENLIQRGDPMSEPSVVHAIVPQLQPAMPFEQTDGLLSRPRLALHPVQLKQGLKRDRDPHAPLARHENVVQLEAPTRKTLDRQIKRMGEETQVESPPIERTQPVCLIQETHELLGTVAQMEEEDTLDASRWIIRGRTGDAVHTRVQARGLQVKCQHFQRLPRPTTKRMRTKTHEKSQSHPLLQPESARSQIELDGLGLSRFHNAKMFVKGAAHRFQLTALAYDAHQMPAHGMPPLGQGLHWSLSSHRPPYPRTQWNKKGDRRTQKLTDKNQR